jgi:MFS family permease
MAASITPLFAPVLGGFINFHFGWSMVFISLTGYITIASVIIWAKFDESLKVSKPIPSPKQMLSQYWGLLTSRYFVNFASISWLNFSLMITTVTVMPFIMQVQIGMTSDEYALWALIPAVGMLLGTSMSNRLRPLIGSKKVLLISPSLHVIAALWLFFCPLEPIYLMLGQLIMIFSNGMALPCAQALVLQPYKEQAGSAAAMSGGGQMIFSSLISTLLIYIGLSQPWHLAIVIVVFAAVNVLNVISGFKAVTPAQ